MLSLHEKSKGDPLVAEKFNLRILSPKNNNNSNSTSPKAAFYLKS